MLFSSASLSSVSLELKSICHTLLLFRATSISDTEMTSRSRLSDDEDETTPKRPSFGSLVAEMIALALPITISSGAQFSIVAVMLSAVGKLGLTELGGAATGIMIVNASAFAIGNGLCGALDTVLSQIYGADPDDKRFGRETQRMCGILIAFSIPIILLWVNIETLLLAIGQRAELAHQTGLFARSMIPGIYSIFGIEMLKRYMQAQHITTPLTIAVVFAAVINPYLQSAFIDRYGFTGAPMAWMTLIYMICLQLIIYLRFFSPKGRCARTWSGLEVRTIVNFWGWGPLLRLGLPCMSITLVEWTTFEMNGLAASFTNDVDLAAYSIANQLNTLAWTCISGLASAVAVIVGNQIGAGNAEDARRFAIIGLFLAAAVSSLLCTALLLFGPQLAARFTTSPEVVERVLDMVLVTCINHFVDSIVTVVNAIARGIGRQKFVATFTSICLIFIGVPTGIIMCFKFGFGVQWLMLGPAVGISVSLIVYTHMFLRLDWSALVPSIDG